MAKPFKGKPAIESIVDASSDSERIAVEPVKTDTTEVPVLDTDKNVYKPNRLGRTKSVVKSERLATIVKDGVAGASGSDGNPVPGIGVMRVLSYSGNDDAAFASGKSSTPKLDESTRGNSRFRKKFDAPVTKINEVVSEQSFIEVESLPSLGKSDSDEGYIGTRRPSALPLQKRHGKHVASPSFSRSLDEIKRDELLFTHGQVVTVQGRARLGTPNTFSYSDDYGNITTGSHIAPLVRGNFVPRGLNIEIDKDNNLTRFEFDVTDISVELTADEEMIANASATHDRVFESRAELHRQLIEDKAGDENADGWNALARAVPHPTKTLGYLEDLEQDAGAVITTAYNKLSTALAYQINRASKDGNQKMLPMVETILSPIARQVDSATLQDASLSNVFSNGYYQAGAASLFIAAFDSVPKFDSKGAFLTLPKGFKSVLPIAEKNSGGLKVSKDFISLLRNSGTFSTIDKDYDPLTPTYISDNFMLAHPYDWSKQYSYKALDANGNPDLSDVVLMGYEYNDHRNRYQTNMDHFLLQGISDYLREFASNFRRPVTGLGKDSLELYIPIVYSQTGISLWELIVLAATPYIQRRRLHTMREILDFTTNHGYPFSGLTDVSENLFGGGKNVLFTDIQSPLKVSKLSVIDALSWMMPEMFNRIDEEDPDYFILPWYFNEREVTFYSNGDWAYLGDKPAMSYPILRSGVTLSYLDSLLDIDPKVLRLSIDRLTKIPFVSNARTTYATTRMDVYKYDLGTDGLLAIVGSKSEATTLNFLKTPRQQGLRVVLPFGFASPALSTLPVAGVSPFLDPDADYSALKTSYRAKAYRNGHTPAVAGNAWVAGINEPASVNHSSGANFKQEWVYDYASLDDEGIINDLPLSMNVGLVTNGLVVGTPSNEYTIQQVPGVTGFSPFIRGHGSNFAAPTKVNSGDTKLVSLATVLWTRLNYLSFVLSPWDNAWKSTVGTEDGAKVDPYDFAYTFGLVGFWASDYEQALLERMQELDDAGLYYMDDKWARMSPLLS